MFFRTDPHAADGVLRRLVDEPAGVADVDRAHVAGCGDCLQRLSAVRADATLAADALSTTTTPDVDRAWQRLSAATTSTATTATAPARATAAARGRRWRTALR